MSNTDGYTLGCDVAKWEAGMRWDIAQRNGIHFAFIKVSDGLMNKEPWAKEHWTGSGSVSVLRSPYHFYRNVHPIQQAEHFARCAGELNWGELPPMLDVEIRGIDWRALRLCLERIRALFQAQPIIYTSRNFWPKAQGWEKEYTLFQAEWSYVADVKPVPGFHPWVFRQFTDRGHGFAYGLPQTCKQLDLDVFRGTPEGLRCLLS